MYELGKVVHNKEVIGIKSKTRLSTSKTLKCQTEKKKEERKLTNQRRKIHITHNAFNSITDAAVITFLILQMKTDIQIK